MSEAGAKKAIKNVVLASHNQGKLKELGDVLAPLGWTLLGMKDFYLPAPEETGTTFEANAKLKAEAAATATGLWAMADDSGLEVDALNGAPGVATADFGGWEKLLEVMKDVPSDMRGARFVCVLALQCKGSETVYFKGTCRGVIALHAAGEAGFGYDPVFIPEGETRTFAQMSKAEKNELSHRGRALTLLMKYARESALNNA